MRLSKRPRRDIAPGYDTSAYDRRRFWQDMARDLVLQRASQDHARALQNAPVPDRERQVSGRSEHSGTSSGTSFSLWRDPDLEDKL
jgi:hypothetical protein